MNTTQHIYILLALILAALGCQPGPTPTPTPCITLTHYDALFTYDVSDGKATVDVRFSDRGDHAITTVRSPSGDLVYRTETLVLDGTAYMRSSSPDDPSTYDAWSMAGTNLGVPDPLYCLDHNQSAGDPAEAHTSYTTRYNGTTTLHEWWVDEHRRPTQERRTSTDKDGKVSVINVTYSGHGEPNPMTAPLPTPTPSPTPTAHPDRLTLTQYSEVCQQWDIVPPDLYEATPDKANLDALARYALTAYQQLSNVKPPSELRDVHAEILDLFQYTFLTVATYMSDRDSQKSTAEPDDTEPDDTFELDLSDALGALDKTQQFLTEALETLPPEAAQVVKECFARDTT